MHRSFYIIILLLALASMSYGQSNIMRRIPRPGTGAAGGKDSLQHRDAFADSITINFRFLDSSRMRGFDSSITDFTKKFPVPWTHFDLGNVGNPTHSMVFPELMKPGWDHGFHSYDVYNFNDYETRFYNTTRPYSELNYQLGSQLEQLIRFQHTQNIMPNWNAAFEYRLINSPGFFQNQNTNHNNYRFSSWYQSKDKRYQNFFVIVGNKLQSGDNGGIKNDQNYLDSIGFNTRSAIPTQLGPNLAASRNFFSSDIATGTRYTNASYLLRQQYDIIGQKDSIVTDSSVIKLFYPRLRLEHTIDYRTYKYRFTDTSPDSVFYLKNYDITGGPTHYFIQDYWKELVNDFSIYQFPDAKNSQQFFKAGATLQNLTGSFDSGLVTQKYHNLFVHGEYRNKTRNKKWDIEAFGNFYLNGMNAGDYNAHIDLKRLISKKIGYLEIGFGNVNRTPSFTFNSQSSFYLPSATSRNFKKENNTEIFGSVEIPKLQLKLTGHYTLLSNYSYYSGFLQPDQYSTVFNVLKLTGEKQFSLGKGWNWRTWVIVQKIAGSAPLNLPLLLTRNQIGYDGKLGFKNLLISFGLELRYYTPYKADVYSPLLGQFTYQDNQQVKLIFPETAGYLHFRIKSFTAYIRAENLNSLNISKFKFTNNNFVSPDYPYPGLQIKMGIYWSFVN
jgi:hypothetical protein